LSNLKTCNALPYVLAARFRKKQSYDEVLLLNQYGRIAEATAWNVFCRKANQLYTPPLSEGPLDGVMRRVMMELAPRLNWEVIEQPLSPDFLAEAESIYLTNSVKGVHWVKKFGNRTYERKGVDQLREILIDGF
jgi:Branched-chain amino acid aminotransferase/4-amino-4-deoxychorismate lyase